jgi:hypothetical protein
MQIKNLTTNSISISYEDAVGRKSLTIPGSGISAGVFASPKLLEAVMNRYSPEQVVFILSSYEVTHIQDNVVPNLYSYCPQVQVPELWNEVMDEVIKRKDQEILDELSDGLLMIDDDKDN